MKYVEIDGIRFEALSLPRKIFNRLVVNPFINYILPKKWIRDFLKQSNSPLANESILRPGGWRAMHLTYENAEPCGLVDKLILQKAVLTLAARNRKRMAVREIRDLIHRYEGKGSIHVVGIGTGPGFNLQEAMHSARTDDVYAVCIDEDSDAFHFGQKMSEAKGMAERVCFLTGDAKSMEEHLKVEVAPHIVKMVGILEYLTDDQVTQLLTTCHTILRSGGSVLANSMENAHGVDPYMRRVFNWHLNYRSPRKIMELFGDCGFSDFQVLREPLGVYGIVAGFKM